MRKFLLRAPSFGSILALLAAWRIWLAGGIAGALLGTLAYFLVPAVYRAQATVLIDQNAEAALPNNCSDLELYTFLQRETDKLIEIAWSDAIMTRLASQTGLAVSELRDQRLHLSQPSDGGWHFRADASDPEQAGTIARAWMDDFTELAASHPEGINPLLEIEITQAENLPVGRTIGLGAYTLGGSVLGAVLLALGLLFFDRREG